jgi:hypothetical protein
MLKVLAMDDESDIISPLISRDSIGGLLSGL